MKNYLKKLISRFFKFTGYKIVKQKTFSVLKNDNSLFTMDAALKRCVNRGINIETVIDVGASDGRWSRACMKHIPRASYFLIEAQLAHKQGLEKFKTNNKAVNYVIAAAGKAEGKIYFDNENLFGGLASQEKLSANFIETPMVSIDAEVDKLNLKPPYLIKLDTHGYEVPILEGAIQTLKHANLVIIETYNYKLTPDSLRYHEMCSYMDALGFRPIEMVDLMLRKFDNTFWQMDTFFVPKDDKAFSYNSYK